MSGMSLKGSALQYPLGSMWGKGFMPPNWGDFVLFKRIEKVAERVLRKMNDSENLRTIWEHSALLREIYFLLDMSSLITSSKVRAWDKSLLPTNIWSVITSAFWISDYNLFFFFKEISYRQKLILNTASTFMKLKSQGKLHRYLWLKFIEIALHLWL